MLDTVILSLDISKFRLMKTHLNRWSPDATPFVKPPYIKLGGRKSATSTRSLTKYDKLKGEYLPRLKIIKSVRNGGISTTLYIEFSAPKLVFNNNFDELSDGDFSQLCKNLVKKLRKLGVVIDIQALLDAKVSVIHYSKNIILTDGRLAKTTVRELAKANISTRRRAKRKSFDNEGEAMYFHTNKWALVAYDKLKEFNRSKVTTKGLLEKDGYCQLSLFDDFTPHMPFEVIRLEARYADRKTIKASLAKAGVKYTNDLTFAELYSETTAKTMLLHEMNDLDTATPSIMHTERTTERLVAELVVNNPRANINTIVEAVGLKTMLSQYGSRGTRSMLNANSGQWSRLMAKIDKLDFTRHQHDGIAIILKDIEAFRRVKLHNYK